MLAPALALALVACGGSGDAAAQKPPKTQSTEGSIVTFPFPDPTTTTVPETTTTERIGLPQSFPVPDSGILTLGGDSTFTQSLTIRGVKGDVVLDYLVSGLTDAGYAIDQQASEPGPPFTAGIGFSDQSVIGAISVVEDSSGELSVMIALAALPTQVKFRA